MGDWHQYGRINERIMKRLFYNIAKICCAALVALPFTACEEDELVKPSALMSESSLTFEAVGAEPQSLTIASDDAWLIDVAEDWITLDRTSGSKTQDVVITVADNVKDGVTDAPRKGTLTIANKRGYSVSTVIYQKGDNYLGVSEMSLSAVAALEDGNYAKVPSAQVVALTADGFVATDESASMYVAYDGELSLGDNVFIAGEKVTLYGFAALNAGEVDVKSSGELQRPAPADLSSVLAAAASVSYVSVEAGLLGHDLQFEQGVDVSVTVLDPKSGLIDLDAVNMHNISAQAYLVGLADGVATLALTEVEDKGVNDNLKAYFYDDFSWMKSYLDAAGVKVGDSIGENNSSADAPNLRSSAALENLLDALLARGYEDLNPSAKVIYAQKYYWKFGKTSNASANNNNGMKLPPMELQGSELLNVDVEFDWAAHMTGSGNIDKVSIVVELTGAGVFDNGTQVSDAFVTTQEKGHIEWQHASVTAKGVNNTTRFIIRPLEYDSVTPDQQRWHLDNIKVSDSDIPYSDPVYANVTVSDEVITFDGTPSEAYAFTVKSDNPWTLAKGADADWFDLDVFDGVAGTEITVKVTCTPNTDTKLRHATIVLASADTRKNIHVVQNSGGSDLDPLISISSGNSVTVLGQGDSFDVKVQANVEFETEIGADWITEVEVPATRAMVETMVKSFKAAPNLTGADRTGTVRFFKGNIESVLTVKQEKFEPSIVVTPAEVKGAVVVPVDGGTVKVDVTSNVEFKVASDILTLPVSSAPAGTHKGISITVPANPTGVARTLKATFTNEEYGYSYDFSVIQVGERLFFDDFSWVAPFVAKWNEANSGKKVGDTIGSGDSSAQAPNVYSDASLSDFISTMNGCGYEDMCPSKKVLYIQDEYLKFGRTGGNNTSLRLPAVSVSAPVDVVLDFDHAAMCQGTGTVDDSKLVIVIEGSGEFENGTKYSDVLALDQAKGTYNWTHSSVKIKGMASDTRLVVVMHRVLKKNGDTYTGEYNYSVSGAGRFFLDNIRISK